MTSKKPPKTSKDGKPRRKSIRQPPKPADEPIQSVRDTIRGRILYELDDLDKKIIKQLMDFPHTSNVVMAEMFEVSEKTIRNHLKKPAVAKAFKELAEKAWEILERGQIVAARAIVKLCTDNDKRIALDACKVILGPLLNKGEININQYQEIIHRTRFGDQGQLIHETETVPLEMPKNTIELLARDVTPEGNHNDDDESEPAV